MMEYESILGEKWPTIAMRLHMSSSSRPAIALLGPSLCAWRVTVWLDEVMCHHLMRACKPSDSRVCMVSRTRTSS